MADIPNSRRYRTVPGRRPVTTVSSLKRDQSRADRKDEGETLAQSQSSPWPFVLLGFALLIAFPYQVLGIIALGLVFCWLSEKQ